MDANMKKRNELLAKTVIKGLESRNMSGYYAKDKETALKQALELIPNGSTIAMGGCMSAHEIGLVKALQDGDYNYIDRAKLEPREGLMAAYDADFFLSSANAVTDDGVLVNIDGNSNRVSCIAQGPKKVIFIVGINKVCPDLDSAMKRARNVAATANAQRFDIKTPCKETGKCFDCKSPDTICCQFLITRYSRHKDRIHVILVNDTLPDSFAMQILPSYATRPAADGAGAEKYQTLLGTEGDWTLECGVDITSTRGAVKNAEPQVLTLGESKLDLKKFSVSPLGAVAVVDEHFTGGIGEGDVVQKDGYTSLEQYAVRDSAGNWMYWMRPSGWTVGEESLYEFVKPADGVDSLTFVPVLYSGTAQAQEALAPLEQGAKLEVTNLSGYTVESFVLDGRRLELTLAPYGPQAYGMVGLEIEPCGADGSPAYDEEQARTCIVDSYTDHATGNVVYTMDFYHDEPLLSSAVQLRYTKLADIALDEANAVTVPLA